jgi:predicted transcriptional regulator
MVNARILIEKAIPKYLGGDTIAAHFADEEIFREEVHKNDNVKITDFMATDIAVIGRDDSLVKAAILATQNQQIRIPVLDDNKKPIGLLTRTELKQVIGYYMGIEGSFE